MRFEYCAVPGPSLVRVQLWRVPARGRARFAGSFAMSREHYEHWRDSMVWGSVHSLSELAVKRDGDGRRNAR
jgi:hypothetical protein